MRRQYAQSTQPGPGPEPEPVPFAEDLLFYAPLSEGDLTDHIGGGTGVLNGGSITWDANKGMYRIVGSGSGGVSFPGGLKFTGVNQIQTQFTMFAEVSMNSYSGNGYGAFIAVVGPGSNYLYLCQVEANGGSSKANTIGKVCYVFNNSVNPTSCLYLNGAQKYAKNSGYGFSGYFNEVHLVCLASNNTSLDCYIKDARVYNRALSAAEVAQL